MRIDLVVPLSNESRFNNKELKYALRSAERFVRHLGKVWLITTSVPDWITNVNVIEVPDIYPNNKDANIIGKLLNASMHPKVSKNFIFLSDDQVFLKPFITYKKKTVYNNRGPDNFTGKSKWHNRMNNTFKFLKSKGINLSYNFDAHTPVLYTKNDFKVLHNVNYASQPGFCINTLLCGLLRFPGVLPQEDVKLTVESADAPINLENKLFLGYNDKGFPLVEPILEELFPDKSSFEK